MELNGAWLTPLVLLPGVALLVLSTSARYAQIHEEFHHLLGHADADVAAHARQLWHRAALFRDALVGLYVSVGLLAIAGTVGGVTSLWFAESAWLVLALTVGGVLAVVFSSVQLIRESALSLDVLRRHRDHLVGG